eukprot:TRINITY_DN6627_c0_g1_i6.p2 TRINITY_DN6627_c0_g1~~TRINITY_DN6627_c0_g1_i6.p2  ORF type:complete len:110 (+),score=11.79 TRINITY_DN6627_c0_g1_i6:617-946(+)
MEKMLTSVTKYSVRHDTPPSPAKSGQVRPSPAKSGQVRPSRLKSTQVDSSQVFTQDVQYCIHLPTSENLAELIPNYHEHFHFFPIKNAFNNKLFNIFYLLVQIFWINLQ